MEKTLVWDMDDTLFKFYDVPNWLDYLKNEDTYPYDVAEPIECIEEVKELCIEAKQNGYKIIVNSWASKKATKEFIQRIRVSKISALDAIMFPYDEIHITKYGRTKADAVRHHGNHQILIDDNKEIRDGWHLGIAVDAKCKNLCEKIREAMKQLG